MKTIVITGATGGMGAETCQRLAQKGPVNLAICARSKLNLDKLTAKLEEAGAKVFAMPVDVTDEVQVEAFFFGIKEAFGSADVLINFAGLSIPAKIPEMRVEDYDRILDVNVKGSFLCSKHFAPLAPPRGGQILNVSSMAAIKANANAPVYCAAKAALNMLSKGLAIQLRQQDIKVTTLNPGGADTDFWGSRQVNREKLLQASDIANVVEFVLSADERVVFHEIFFESFRNT